MFAINQPLVRTKPKPSAGWGVHIPVKGMNTPIMGESPFEVAQEAQRILTANQESFRIIDLWADLNIQWTQRVVSDSALVPLQNLLDIVTPTPAPQREGSLELKHPPQEWGPLGWGMLIMYLASNNYSWDRFRLLVGQLLDWVNPSLNPSIGCSECFQHFSATVAELNASPIYDRKTARQWLVDTMNGVNVRKGESTLTLDQAHKIHPWT